MGARTKRLAGESGVAAYKTGIWVDYLARGSQQTGALLVRLFFAKCGVGGTLLRLRGQTFTRSERRTSFPAFVD
jgi:hypothetical protein